MIYEKARNLVFDYFIKEKELNKVNHDIERYLRNMPHDNADASIFIMDKMDEEILKRDEIKDEIKLLKSEIELLLRVFT